MKNYFILNFLSSDYGNTPCTRKSIISTLINKVQINNWSSIIDINNNRLHCFYTGETFLLHDIDREFNYRSQNVDFGEELHEELHARLHCDRRKNQTLCLHVLLHRFTLQYRLRRHSTGHTLVRCFCHCLPSFNVMITLLSSNCKPSVVAYLPFEGYTIPI